MEPPETPRPEAPAVVAGYVVFVGPSSNQPAGGSDQAICARQATVAPAFGTMD